MCPCLQQYFNIVIVLLLEEGISLIVDSGAMWWYLANTVLITQVKILLQKEVIYVMCVQDTLTCH